MSAVREVAALLWKRHWRRGPEAPSAEADQAGALDAQVPGQPSADAQAGHLEGAGAAGEREQQRQRGDGHLPQAG
ncbi:MAG TPA: hypothetical protein VIG99_30815, partial [Myxococcaceae bacterium]